MQARGYMVEADYDGQTLTARGTNKASHVALRDQIASVDLKRASALANGRLTVHTVDGEKYQLHFRKKQTPGFEALAAELG